MVPLTEAMQKEYEEVSTCHLCKKPFDNPEKNWKVHDHCHYTGLYRGAAQNNCKSQVQDSQIYPSSFIILITMLTSSYDNSGEKFQTQDIGVIAENKEKYISFNVKIDVQLKTDGKPVTKKIELRFIDSCRFMAVKSRIR